MSTEIYNGYILAPSTDVFDFVARVRAVMNPIRDLLDAKELAEIAVRLIDDADLAGTDRPNSPLTAAFLEFDTCQREMTAGSLLHDPNRFEMALGSDRGRVLVLLYADRDELREAFEAMDCVAEYGYWNNADQPEGVSEEEWDERRDAWNRVLPGAGVPAENMLSMRLRVDHFVGMLRLARLTDGAVNPLVLDAVPGKQERAERLVRAARWTTPDDSDPSDWLGQLRLVGSGITDVAAQVASLLPDINAADPTGSARKTDLAEASRIVADDARAFRSSVVGDTTRGTA